jgi:hypothetical protein
MPLPRPAPSQIDAREATVASQPASGLNAMAVRDYPDLPFAEHLRMVRLLRDEGLLSEAEFQDKKAEILRRA